VGTDPGQNFSVRFANRLSPNLGDLEINEVGGDEHTGFDGGARGDNRNGEVRCPYLLEGAHVARVKDGGVSNAIGPLLHQGRVFINGQHIATKFVELASGGRAKAP
jgi:hypothetical protein